MIATTTKKIFFLSFLLFSILVSTFYFYTKSNDFKGRKLQPNEFLFLQRSYPYGKLKTNNIQEIEAWRNSKKIENRETNNVAWQLVGPQNIGGRITDIDIPSNSTSTYIVGTATGGIFKSTNSGASWSAVFDTQNTLSIGDIDISKSNNNLVLVGTGEPNSGGGSTTYDGTGVYLSTDGGDTWQSKGLSNVGSIGKVIIDPTNSNKMYVASMGTLYAQSTNRGVYKSTDAGTTWTKTLFVSNKTGVIDMAINPVNPNILYAATWERTRTPITRIYGGATSNIYKSIDAGITWTLLTNGLPTNSDKGRISIDISNSDPEILFASYTNSDGTTIELFKSINAGATWTTLSSTDITPSPYNWWFGGVFINPTNSNNVFIQEFNSHYSIDGGTSWSTATGTSEAIHVDQHAVAFNSNNEILLGNDGGLYKSTNGSSFTKINNLPISQAYRIDVNPINSNQVYAGFQDNGTCRTLTGGINNWNPIFGGDGMQPRVNPNINTILFVQYQYGAFFRSTNNGSSFTNSTSGISTTQPRNWDTPYVFDPANPNIMYFGTSNLHKSTNNGVSWSSISGNLSKSIYTGTQKYGTITSIDVSPLNSSLIFIGTDDGNVWKSTNGGGTYTKISDLLPNKWVTCVRASPTNANQVYVTYSGYRYNLDDSNLFVSDNLGSSWQDLSADLPNTPLSDIQIAVNNKLYLASDIGVLVSNNLGVNWDFLGSNMPSVVVTDLVLHTGSNFLFAGTFGRGVYKIDLSQVNLTSQSFASSISNLRMYPNPVKDYLYIDFEPKQQTDFKADFYDLKGNLIKKYLLQNSKSEKQTIKINIESLPKGVYIVKINNEPKAHKIVIY